jgi:hypothetical protein
VSSCTSARNPSALVVTRTGLPMYTTLICFFPPAPPQPLPLRLLPELVPAGAPRWALPPFGACRLPSINDPRISRRASKFNNNGDQKEWAEATARRAGLLLWREEGGVFMVLGIELSSFGKTMRGQRVVQTNF